MDGLRQAELLSERRRQWDQRRFATPTSPRSILTIGEARLFKLDGCTFERRGTRYRAHVDNRRRATSRSPSRPLGSFAFVWPWPMISKTDGPASRAPNASRGVSDAYL